jgi:hypothetical protein
MTTQHMASQSASTSPLKVDAIQLIFFLLGAPHIYGALRSNAIQRKEGSIPTYSYLLPLAAVIAGGVELWLL